MTVPVLDDDYFARRRKEREWESALLRLGLYQSSAWAALRSHEKALGIERTEDDDKDDYAAGRIDLEELERRVARRVRELNP